MKVADDVRLFVLDDGGALFVGPAQELCALNASATFIWCCIEDGLSPEQIVDGYRRSFEVATADAERHVVDALAQWQGLGYIDGFAIPPGSEQPLVQSLARLLVNESLRVEFEQSPRKMAARFGVRSEELADFLALDSRALAQQAELLRARQTRTRAESAASHTAVFSTVLDDGTSFLAAVASATLRHPSASTVARTYRLLDTIFCLRVDTREQAARIEPVLAHLGHDAAEKVDSVLNLLEIDGSHVVLVDGVPVEHCSELDALAPLVKSRIRRIATNRHHFAFEIHAGVVATGEECILLPGAPGQGKTTLTAALSCAGFRYFSDEVALLEEPDLMVRPVPLSLGIKSGAVEVLAPLYPEVGELAVHAREDEQRVRYLSPPGYGPDLPAALPVRWIVFPAYDASVETRLESISRTEALRRLIEECMVLPELLNEARVYALVRWLRGVECMQLPLSSLASAVELIKGHCQTPRTPGP